MLHFFRKYQKIVFLFTTIVIVISVVFFGTYQAIFPDFRGSNEQEESYVGQMSRFLDSENWMASRNFFASNFLNDSFISQEFLETGMGEVLVNHNPDRFKTAFQERHEKEKHYRPYAHPFLPTLTAQAVWATLNSEIPEKLGALQKGEGSYQERSALFIAQKKLPPAWLTQIIRYQESSNPRVPQDPRLTKEDLALFSYHSISDWFGQEFVNAISEQVIHVAALARKMGYKVSREELMADLIGRSNQLYLEIKDKVQLPVSSGHGLFMLYASQLGMKEETILKMWEDVTLFRRLMHSVGDAALCDPLVFSEFYAFAQENALVELIQVSQEARLNSLEDLKRFEAYLAAVGEKKSGPFDIPREYAPIKNIEEKAPSLVGKRFRIYYSHVNKQDLAAKVGVKETLNWQCAPKNWEKLKEQFPDLTRRVGTPFAILESLESKERKLVDQFARTQIVEEHPEWISEALVAAEMKEKELFLTNKTEKPFVGIHDPAELVSAFDKQDELACFSQDNQHYYRFLVQERSDKKEVMSYKLALKANVLDSLVDSLFIEERLQEVVDATPKAFKGHPHAYRFAEYLRKSVEKPLEGALVAQFPIVKVQKNINRAEKSLMSLDAILKLQELELSTLQVDFVEGPYFYRNLGKGPKGVMPIAKLLESQRLLANEARSRYFASLLKAS